MKRKKVFGLDIRSLGAFRVVIGLVLIYDLLFERLFYFKELYGSNGFMNQNFLNSTIYKDSIFGFIQTSAEMPFVFALALISYSCFVLGYLHKVNRILTPLLYVYISHKYFLTLIGADQIITVLLLFSIFLPLDKTFLIKSKNTYKNYEIRGIPTWAILIQISMIYFFNAINKTGNLWLSGDAVKVAVSDTILSRPYSYLLANNDLLNHFATYFSYAFEFLFPLLLFFPFKNRKIRLLLSFFVIIFHFSISFFMNVGHFHLAFLSVAILLLPPKFWILLSKKKIPLENNLLLKKSSNLVKISASVLLFIAIQKNVFLFLNRFTFSDTNTYQIIYSPFKYLVEVPLSTPFLSQKWVFFTPNPPNEMGFITIEGVDYKERIEILSSLNPFKKENNYKTESVPALSRFGIGVRYLLEKSHSNEEFAKKKNAIEVTNLWTTYNMNRIKRDYDIDKYKKIEFILYSCKSDSLLIKNYMEFTKIKLYEK